MATAKRKSKMGKAGKTAKPEWQTKTDPKTGNEFYFNNLTKQVSWTRPAALGGVAAPQPAAAAEGVQFEEKVDPSSGQTYCVNTATGECQWTAP